MNHVCIVCEDGWIFRGIEDGNLPNSIRLIDSEVTGWRDGIGNLAKGYFGYHLEKIGEVIIAKDKVLFEIPCEW